MLCAMD